MFCNKCGRKVEEGSKFCSSCGAAINNNQSSVIQSNLKNINEGDDTSTTTKTINSENQFNESYNNIINPNMTKYAIASVAIPTVAIIIYWYIGLPVYVALIFGGLGYECAKKGKEANKTLSTIGYILNSILVIISIIMFFAIIIKKSM